MLPTRPPTFVLAASLLITGAARAQHDAQRNAVRTETSLLTSRQDLAIAQLSVYRALGGNWIAEQADEQDSEGDLR